MVPGLQATSTMVLIAPIISSDAMYGQRGMAWSLLARRRPAAAEGVPGGNARTPP